MKMTWGLKVLGTDFANEDCSLKVAQGSFDVFLPASPFTLPLTPSSLQYTFMPPPPCLVTSLPFSYPPILP